MPYYGYYLYYDPYFYLLIFGFLISILAQSAIQSAYRRYSAVPSRRGYTGAQVAYNILLANGVQGIEIVETRGTLSDHYSPGKGQIALSQGVYGRPTIAALAVAAHETGHVLQKQAGYFPYRLRTLLVPITQFGSAAAIPLVLIGLLMGNYLLAQIGVIAFAAVLAFQVVTLPVEFNASRRALAQLEAGGYLEPDEIPGAKKVLRAAAFTYVAAALVSLFQLLRLLAMTNRRR